MSRPLSLAAVMAAIAACDDPPPKRAPVVAVTMQAPDASQAEPVAPAPAGSSAKVVSRSGRVVLQRGDDAGWSEVNVGDDVLPDDSIRTEEGQVGLELEDVKLELHDRSELKVGAIEAGSLKATVKGRVEAKVTEGKGRLELGVQGSDAKIRTEGGHLSVLAGGTGVVAVGALSGRVDLTSAGKSVTLSEGEVSRARPGAAPEQASKALKRVLLSVSWPEQQHTNKPTVPVTGKVEAGSRVLVQGKGVEPGADGKFRVEVPLRLGDQQVAVTVVDPMGRTKVEKTAINYDPVAPHLKLKNVPFQTTP